MAFNVAALSLGRAIGAPIGTFLYRFGFSFVVVGAVPFTSLLFWLCTKCKKLVRLYQKSLLE